MRNADLRQRLIRAAEQEIAACGPAKASLRAIARRVGVSHQATAHHFADRAGLFTALAVEGFELLLSRTRAAVSGVAVAGGQQVTAAGVAYVEFAARQPTMFDVMFRPELLHTDDPALGEVRLAHRALLLDLVGAAQATGWAASVPTEELVTIGWATVHGLAVLQRDAQLTVVPTDVDLDPAKLLVVIGQALGALA
ncbi:TetR/AcrR family transcriptional regulator [Nocardioides daeguensis]|uniref:TetR/AcrR family transcriptional regulator n=1 Tax=Nocardioides daeguensis TaxID=908359 RepID=A0ABP6V674_9ACTN|nr:TetR/AcrR family transcriptional regulator [Nocardioides daeguensis]MBV6726545.1 TetR/AcrR family transcriptional regulator [Nocardioides daeguensis]MCR1772388.1 TetR/AcrR family transcriptional regulator [Nocardioides daeguensis]